MPYNIRLNSIHYLVMKIPKKSELQQIAFNHSWGTDFLYFMSHYQKCIVNPHSFLVIDTTLASDNSLRFRNNLSEWIKKVILIVYDKIRDLKPQYEIIREAAKRSALSSQKLAGDK